MLYFKLWFTLKRGESIDPTLIYLIESVVIDWSHQVHAFLSKDSSQPILEGLDPGPLVEIEFWKARTSNLEDIYSQVKISSLFTSFYIQGIFIWTITKLNLYF